MPVHPRSFDILPLCLTAHLSGALDGTHSRIALRRVVASFIWILGFDINRLTIADFRDVGFLGV